MELGLKNKIAMVGGISLRAKQAARFFAVAKQNDKIVLYRRTSAQSADRFQDNDQASAVVSRARAFRDGVVMSYEHDGVAG